LNRVLVTGASGFVGRHTLEPLLEHGFEVHAVSRSEPAAGRSDGVVWHSGDLLGADETERLVAAVSPTHLLHLAWVTEHSVYWTSPENLDWVACSLRLLRAFQEAGGQRAVLAGTCAEYDWSGTCCSPGTPLAPSTLYGVCKNALRQMAEAYAEAAGMSLAWARIFFAFGPGEQPERVVASVARALAEKRPARCSAGHQVRDFLYIKDLASAFAALVASDVAGTLDIGSGVGRKLRDVLSRLQAIAEQENVVEFGAVPGRAEPSTIVADVTRLRCEVGWEAPAGLDDGLAETLAWWRENATS
jgi:nucleoside-diphosphate-sugar epimerase